MQESSQIWWQEITGPRTFIANITEHLLDASVIVKVPDDLPWRHEMRQEIQSELREQYEYEEISVIIIDAEEEVGENTAIGAFVLERFALGDVARQYRKKSGKSITQYIIQKNVLQNDVLWVKGITSETVKRWLDFLLEFNACNSKKSRIVLEIRDDIQYPEQNTVEEIDYSSYISDNNLQLFNSILLDRMPNITGAWKRYLSALAACLCETDAEIAEYFLNEHAEQAGSPISILKTIAQDSDYSRRGAADGSSHILSLVRHKCTSQIERRIWKAQLQVLFPVVEAERINLIERIKHDLTAMISVREIRQYGESIVNPYDFEWGTLFYAMKLTSINGEYYLKSLSKADREEIRRFRDYRNNLAHGDCCTVTQVSEILAVAPSEQEKQLKSLV